MTSSSDAPPVPDLPATPTGVRTPFGAAVERFASRWRHLVLTGLALGVAIFLLAPRYNDAQRADAPETFRSIVEAGPSWRFAVAAVVDVAFAAAYGLLGLALGWQERPGEGRRWGLARRAAGSAIAIGAVADLGENALVLAGTIGSGAVTDGSIAAMRTLGSTKWALGLGGALVLAIGTVVGGRRTRDAA